ncbi:hypothetical protein DACRYDRAFT_23136, partial [Dacryopinax primogenitus]
MLPLEPPEPEPLSLSDMLHMDSDEDDSGEDEIDDGIIEELSEPQRRFRRPTYGHNKSNGQNGALRSNTQQGSSTKVDPAIVEYQI